MGAKTASGLFKFRLTLIRSSIGVYVLLLLFNRSELYSFTSFYNWEIISTNVMIETK